MKRFLYLATCLFLVTSLCLCFAACNGDNTTGSSNGSNNATSSVAGSTQDSSESTLDSSIGTTDSSDKPTDTPVTDSSASTSSSNGGTEDTTDSSVNTPGEDGHEHTYATEYSYDDKSHFYAATCEHTGERAGVEAHEHDAVTGNCKCGHHKHIYEDKYSYDVDNHFYKAICEHFDEVTGIEAHSFDENNTCKCGRVLDEFGIMLEKLIENKGAITSGKSTQTNNNLLNGAVSSTIVNYIFYDSYVYVKEESDYINEYYYSDKEGKLFAVFIQNGGKPTIDSEASRESLNGAKYGFGCIGEYESYACGAESLIEFFYEKGIVVAPSTYKTSKEGNEFSLSYGFCVVDGWVDYYYTVSVSFTFDEKTNSLATTSIVVDRYAKESYTVVDGEYVLNEDAAYNYRTTFEVTQSTEPNAASENPYDSSQVILESLVVTDKNKKKIDDITIKQRADEEIILFLSNITPSTAMLELCDIEIIVLNEADGTPVAINPFFNSFNTSYTFLVTTPGRYTVEVRVNDMTFTTTLETLPKLPVSIGAQVYDYSAGIFNKTKRAEAYLDTELYFTSFVESGFDGDYVAKLVGSNASNATLTSGSIDGKEATIFKSSVIGEYVIEIASKYNAEVVCHLRITVTEPPSIEEILKGTHFKKDEYGKEVINVVFNGDDNTAKIVFMHPDYGYEPIESVITYSIVDGKIEYTTNEDSDELLEGIYISKQHQLVVTILGEEYVLERLIVKAELISSGQITIQDKSVENGALSKYAFELYSDGEIVIYKGYSKTRDIGLTNKNGEYILRRMGKEEVVLVKINGDAGALAGEYLVEGDVGVVISVDNEATYVEEPKYGTIEVVDFAGANGGSKHSFTYGYEIIDDEFVIYRYDVVTDEAKLVDLGGEYSFLYPGVLSAQILEKLEGSDDVLGGEYSIDMNLGMIIHIADVIITPGASAPSRPVVVEKQYGALYLEDQDESGDDLSGTYYYEIVDGSFVIYKDGVVINDFMIIINLDGTYSFQTAGMVPQILIKDDGVEGGLEGTYRVPGADGESGKYCLFSVTFVPGVLETEENFGTLVIDDKNTGSISGTYYYLITEGVLEFYKEDGTKITDEFYITADIGGEAYYFQSIDFLIQQPLIKVEGISVLLGGKYTVSGENGVAYEFVFTPGEGEIPEIAE